MHPKLLKALKASIEKWKLIAEGKEVSRFGSNCPLCRACNSKKFGCTLAEKGKYFPCPVRENTKMPECRGTPWRDFYRDATWATEEGYALRAVTDIAKEDARRELEFLESLLPKNAKQT